MNFEMIVACDVDGIIGNNNSLPWHIPEDLRYFKKITENHIIVMGRKTFESLPNGPLKNRVHIVLSNSINNYYNYEQVIVTNKENFPNIINNVRKGKRIFIIGGNEIYNLFLPYCSIIHLTQIYNSFHGNVKLDCYHNIIDNYDLVYKSDMKNYNDIIYNFNSYIK
tara:strand:- start:12 stop:509 length:498 start_codon:yes stop_codon:yes gene_type:complete